MKIIMVSLISVALILASCRNEAVKPSYSPPVRVKVADIKMPASAIPVHSNGILVSSEELKLSFKTGGIIADIPVREGSRVNKGAVLAALDLSEISASAEQAELGYNKALRDFERVSNLYIDSVATLEQKQNAATALDVAKSNLRVVNFNLTHSRIIAPDNGIILKKFVKENELVASGYPVILFGSSGSFWKVRAGFSDKDMVRINIGDSARITFDAYPGVGFKASVSQVGELANPMTGTYEVELDLEETDYRLASGFVAGVDLFTSARDTFTVVPVESVVEADGNKGFIYVLKAEDEVIRVEIEIVLVTGSSIAVKGIPDGITKVISGGAAYIREGSKVEVVR